MAQMQQTANTLQGAIAKSTLDTSHPGVLRQLNEYANSERYNQGEIGRRLRYLLRAANPDALTAIGDWLSTATEPGCEANISPEPSLSLLVNNLPVTTQETFLLLDALENVLLPTPTVPATLVTVGR